MVPPGQGEGFCLERDGSRDVPAQERPEWVLKSPLGGMWSPCRGKGRKSQEGGGGSGIWAGRQYVNEQWRESLERKVSVCPGTCFISHVPLSSLKPHPIRDIKGAGRGGHTPHTHWSGVVTAHQSQTRGGSCHWLSHLWSPGLGTWLQAEVGRPWGRARDPQAEAGDPAVSRSLSSVRSRTGSNWARTSSICEPQRANCAPVTTYSKL